MTTHVTLQNGCRIPALGLGTWMSQPGKVGKAVEYAITEAGYRHIDCAAAYENEKEIGTALHEAFKKVKRNDVFITSKLWNTNHHPDNIENACKQTLTDLGLEYVDLYLMHWGIAFRHKNDSVPEGRHRTVPTEKVSVQETWKGMEKLVKKGLVKSIGVANFNVLMLVDLLTYAKIIPVMNQVELHPYNAQEELIAFCLDNHIAVTGYSPLGRPGERTDGPQLSEETIIQRFAKKYGKTSSQILLRWAVERGTVVIPKSVTPERIAENIDIFDFSLTKSEIAEITSLNRNLRFVNPNEAWGIPVFA